MDTGSMTGFDGKYRKLLLESMQLQYGCMFNRQVLHSGLRPLSVFLYERLKSFKKFENQGTSLQILHL